MISILRSVYPYYSTDALDPFLGIMTMAANCGSIPLAMYALKMSDDGLIILNTVGAIGASSPSRHGLYLDQRTKLVTEATLFGPHTIPAADYVWGEAGTLAVDILNTIRGGDDIEAPFTNKHGAEELVRMRTLDPHDLLGKATGSKLASVEDLGSAIGKAYEFRRGLEKFMV